MPKVLLYPPAVSRDTRRRLDAEAERYLCPVCGPRCYGLRFAEITTVTDEEHSQTSGEINRALLAPAVAAGRRIYRAYKFVCDGGQPVTSPVNDTLKG